MKHCIINGRFLSRRVTGVERFALEIINCLDILMEDKGPYFTLAVPGDVKQVPKYRNIEVKRVGHLKGNLWEQVSLPLFLFFNRRKTAAAHDKKAVRHNGIISTVERHAASVPYKKAVGHRAILLNLCNTSPLFYPGIVCIHDMKTFAEPCFYRRLFRLWYRLLFSNAVKRAQAILTVSEFSKREILKYFHGKNPWKRKDILIIPNGSSHMEAIEEDDSILEKYGLKEGKYYFSLGSLDRNKNQRWIIEAAKREPKRVFVIAGGGNKRVFSKGGMPKGSCEIPKNVIFTGYLSDGCVKALMRHSRGFLFPSLYEGFGLPPLEALSAGTPSLVVSDIPVMREIFGNAAVYIDPKSRGDIPTLHKISEDERINILKRFSWEKSAQKLYRLILALSI